MYLLGYKSILRDGNESLANVNGVSCYHFGLKSFHSITEVNQVHQA